MKTTFDHLRKQASDYAAASEPVETRHIVFRDKLNDLIVKEVASHCFVYGDNYLTVLEYFGVEE